jgi:hypothetical protein
LDEIAVAHTGSLNDPGKTIQNRSGVLKPIVVFSQQHAMAAVSIAVKSGKIGHDPRPQGDSDECNAPTRAGRSLPGIKWIFTGFETDARDGGADG